MSAQVLRIWSEMPSGPIALCSWRLERCFVTPFTANDSGGRGYFTLVKDVSDAEVSLLKTDTN